MLPETFTRLQIAPSRLQMLASDLGAISVGPDKTRSLSICLTHIETALLWFQHDAAERAALPPPDPVIEGAG